MIRKDKKRDRKEKKLQQRADNTETQPNEHMKGFMVLKDAVEMKMRIERLSF